MLENHQIKKLIFNILNLRSTVPVTQGPQWLGIRKFCKHKIKDNTVHRKLQVLEDWEHGLSVLNCSVLYIRVEWVFREKNWAPCKLCQIVLGPQIQNFYFKYCLLTWRRASENVDSFLKNGKTICYLTIWKVTPETKFVPSFFLKLKTKRNSKNRFSFDQVKNKFASYGDRKKYIHKTYYFNFSFWR